MPCRQNLKKEYRGSNLKHKKRLWGLNHKEFKKKKKKRKSQGWIGRLILRYTQKAVSVVGSPQGLSPSLLLHLHRNLYFRYCPNTWRSPVNFAWRSAITSRTKQPQKNSLLIYVILNQASCIWQAPNGKSTILPYSIVIKEKQRKSKPSNFHSLSDLGCSPIPGVCATLDPMIGLEWDWTAVLAVPNWAPSLTCAVWFTLAETTHPSSTRGWMSDPLTLSFEK